MSSKDTSHQQVPRREHRKQMHPCVLCQQRKVRCDRNEPCANCTKAGIACIPASTLPPRKRKRRFPEAELLARLRRYEHHLQNYGADIDAINREGSQDGVSSVLPTNTSTTSKSNTKSLLSEPQDVRTRSVRRSLRHVESNLNLGVNDEFRDAEEFLQGSSEDDMFANPIIKTYEELSGDGDLLFGSQTTQKLTSLHPSPVHIFRLWQTFLDNVNPLSKIFHAPSVQQKVLDATADVEDIPKGTEALMFSIYAAATISMNEPECQKLFNEKKEVVLARFQSGARRALRIAGYLRSSDIVVLQAFALYLLSCMQLTIDPRALFCLTGVAIRIAQRMGLSTDGTSYAISPFEVEMRRRLWWQLVLIDSRVAEISGAGTSMLTYAWNTKIPANVNDSDLVYDMRDPPVERPGLTEMVFVRLRCEVTQFVQKSQATTGSLTTEEEAIGAFEGRLEREYLTYCDPSIPVHLMSSMVTKSAFCKLRMGLRHSRLISNQSNSLPQAEKDKVSQHSLRMLEIHNETMDNPSLRGYIWYKYANYPLPAHIYLLCALRHRTSDEFAERAWQQLSESAETHMKHDGLHPRFAKANDNFIYYALGNLIVKTWEARESAFQDSSHVLPTPLFISEYRKQLAKKKSKTQLTLNETSPLLQTDQGIAAQFSILDTDSIGIGRELDQSMLHGMFPTNSSPTDWDFWNDMLQGGDSMQGVDMIQPLYNSQI